MTILKQNVYNGCSRASQSMFPCAMLTTEITYERSLHILINSEVAQLLFNQPTNILVITEPNNKSQKTRVKMSEQNQEPIDYDDIIIISVSPLPSPTGSFGRNPADPPSPGAGETDEQIREIQARAREPRQNSPPRSPALSESDASSTRSNNDVADDLQCSLCGLGREITVQFRGCSHSSCTGCMKNLWWSKVQHPTHYPTWFRCPWCRTEITEVGMLSRQPSSGNVVVVHGEVSFTVRTWEKLVEWMNTRSKRMGVKAKEARVSAL